MGATAIVSAIVSRVSALASGTPAAAIFAEVQGFDPDNMQAQLDALQDCDGRFAIVTHDGTDYATERAGRVLRGDRGHDCAVLVSSAAWGGAAATAGRGALDAAEAIAEGMLGKWNDAFTVEVQRVERYTPTNDAAKVSSRIVYRVALRITETDRIRVALDR